MKFDVPDLLRPLRCIFVAPPPSTVDRYDTIDVIRGFAAIAILFWHYQHFIVLGVAAEGGRTAYPLYGVFWPFYEYGGIAVQLFWIVSGFVFTAVYHGRNITSREFMVHRFARLYPLHFLTLIAVIVLQLANLRLFGQELIYPMGDWSAFTRQLFMASGWGPQAAFTFNAPVWSVSAEVLVYALFWLLLPWLLRWGTFLPMVIAVLARILAPGWPVADCSFYFFTGVAIFSVLQTVPTVISSIVATALAITAVALCLFGMTGIGLYLGFCALTLASGLLDRAGIGRICTKVPWISDNCYGIYLAHIPVQLLIIVILGMIGQSRDIAFSPYFLFAFLAVMMVIARLLFVYVEKPARSLIRRKLSR